MILQAQHQEATALMTLTLTYGAISSKKLDVCVVCVCESCKSNKLISISMENTLVRARVPEGIQPVIALTLIDQYLPGFNY